MPTVTYLSDTHLEFYDHPISYDTLMDVDTTNTTNKDILCLAGDIGYPEMISYQTFLEYVSKHYKYVFVIAGNHEYYQTKQSVNKSIQTTNEMIKQICSHFTNVHFLCETSYYIEEYDLHILGTTLWSDYSDEQINYNYNDFRKIHNMSLYGYMNRLHELSVCFLKNELEKYKNDTSKVLVMTHHMPSFELIDPKYKDSGMNDLFATNLHKLFHEYKIDHWICGHSHTSVEKKIENTNVWMNPIGYPRENKKNVWISSFEI